MLMFRTRLDLCQLSAVNAFSVRCFCNPLKCGPSTATPSYGKNDRIESYAWYFAAAAKYASKETDWRLGMSTLYLSHRSCPLMQRLSRTMRSRYTRLPDRQLNAGEVWYPSRKR